MGEVVRIDKRKGVRSNQDYLEEFLEAIGLEGGSVHTLRAYRRDLEGLFEGLEGVGLEDISPADLRGRFRKMEQEGKKETAINRSIASAKSFFGFLVRNGYFVSNPMVNVRSIKVQEGKTPEYLTVDEMDRLLDMPRLDRRSGLRDLAVLMLFYNTGIRVGEFCALNRSDVVIPLRWDGELGVVGKGDRVR